MNTEKLDLCGMELKADFTAGAIGDRMMTVCVLRAHDRTWAGAAVLMPGEMMDQEQGRRIAFKRAARAMAYDIASETLDDGLMHPFIAAFKLAVKGIVSLARQARWKLRHPDLQEVLREAEEERQARDEMVEQWRVFGG